jgi:two-component system chemotaxis response regulator CheB
MTSEEIRHTIASIHYNAIIIGGSAGGAQALVVILSALPKDFTLPVLAVQHLHPSDEGSFAEHLAGQTGLHVKEPCDKERIEKGKVYTAPANYHMLVEKDGTISLSVDERVNWSRPSIDVLFESAAAAWGKEVVAVVLSGANSDGAKGMLEVKKAGGFTIAQDPKSAQHNVMPKAAIDAGAVDEVLKAEEIGLLLAGLNKQAGNKKNEK